MDAVNQYKCDLTEAENAMAGSIISILEKNLSRQSKVKDNAMRCTMFVDKLSLSLDGIMAILNQIPGLSEENVQRITILGKIVDKELDNLFNWIQNPTYNPDHPYGASIMNQAREHFENWRPPLNISDNKL
jgi:hypothetical protein